jgi:hypothetical protein
MGLGSSINIIVLLLLQAVTNKVVETSPHVCTHMFHHLGIQASLKASDLLGINIHHISGIAAQVIERMQILGHSLRALIQC